MFLPHSVPKGPLGLVQGLPKFKRALWGDKPEGLLPENCPNFSFFLFGPGRFNYDYRKASGRKKLQFFSGKLKSLRQAPTKSGYFNYGPGKLKFSQGKQFGKRLLSPLVQAHRVGFN
jgi:hypothetical protein